MVLAVQVPASSRGLQYGDGLFDQAFGFGGVASLEGTEAEQVQGLWVLGVAAQNFFVQGGGGEGVPG